MKTKIKLKLLTIFTTLMLLFGTTTFAQAECTLQFGVFINGLHVEYWCCTGPEGCFWDIYV